MSRFAILAGASVLAAAPAFAQDQAALQQLDDAWAAAFNKGDAKAVASMYTPDAYLLPDRAPLARGRAAIAASIQKLIAGGTYQNDLKLAVQSVHPLGPSAVSEIGTYSITTKGQGPELGKFTAVFRKVGGKWLLQTDIWNANK